MWHPILYARYEIAKILKGLLTGTMSDTGDPEITAVIVSVLMVLWDQSHYIWPIMARHNLYSLSWISGVEIKVHPIDMC